MLDKIEEAYNLTLRATNSLDIDQKPKEPTHKDMGQNNLGCRLFRMESYDEAIEVLEKAFSQATKGLDTNKHAICLLILNNLLCLYQLLEKMSNLKDMEDNFNLDILIDQKFEERLITNEGLYCKLLGNYGDFCSFLSDYKEASFYREKSRRAYERSLEIKTKKYSENSLEVADSFTNLG